MLIYVQIYFYITILFLVNRHFWWRVRPETSVTFILRGTGIVLVLFYIYPIVPYALALCAMFLLLFQHVGDLRSATIYSIPDQFSWLSVDLKYSCYAPTRQPYPVDKSKLFFCWSYLWARPLHGWARVCYSIWR